AAELEARGQAEAAAPPAEDYAVDVATAAPAAPASVAAEGTALRPGDVVKDRYEIVRTLAAGGMGDIYEAKHVGLSARYALKVLQLEMAANPEAMERFRLEAQITDALRHPN